MHRLAAVALFLLLTVGSARAHDLGVSEVRLTEAAGARYRLTVALHGNPARPFDVPVDVPFDVPVLPDRCFMVDGSRAPAATVDFQVDFDCRGARLRFDDRLVLPWQRDGVLLSVRWLDGSSASRFFIARDGVVTIDLAELAAGSGTFGQAVWRYGWLGVEHILFGIDHLLFVLALMLVVRDAWSLIRTITAFTVSHSITLGLATLGFVAVPAAPVEAAIALSIVFVAAEGLRGGSVGVFGGHPSHQSEDQSKDPVFRPDGDVGRSRNSGAVRRWPWLAAFAFGLLHGFGFAGALTSIGLPTQEIPLALLCFNVGVEIGQVLFIAAILTLHRSLMRIAIRRPDWVATGVSYAIGTAATVWLFERVGAMLPG